MKKRFSKEFLEIQPYDSKKDKLQCLMCGDWYDSISSQHLKYKHDNMTVKDYKEEFGINKWQPLTNNNLYETKSNVGNTICVHNLKPANEVGGGMLGKKNPRRGQTKRSLHKHYVGMAEKVKRGWNEGKYEYLREVRSINAKKQWEKYREEL